MNEDSNRSWNGHKSRSARRGSAAKTWAVTGVAIVALGGAWLGYSHHKGTDAAQAAPALPSVVVSKPVSRELDSRLGFLGQFSAVDRVELRAQVGGTLTDIHFRDGDVVHKGDLLFSIDPRPYEIRLAGANAQFEAATARRELADRELRRAQELKRNDVGTDQNVDQRTSDLRAAQAAVDDAKSQIRDAQFDLEHCQIVAPFTGRIGNHLVSIGNLISGSRAGSSPTTLLATIVSLDPIYLDFDMSESDYKTFSRYKLQAKGPGAGKVEVVLGNESKFVREGTFDFIDNAIDRSSGTIHARATVPNPGYLLTAGEFARVRLIASAPAPSLLVPDSAVLPDQSQHLVMTVAADGTVVPKRVEIEDIRGGLRVIRSGISSDDKVIIDGIAFATPGSKVAPQDGAIQYAAEGQP